MATLFLAPTQNYVQKTLSGAIDDSVTTITLSSTTNLQAPGYIVINRVDSAGNKLASSVREVVSYTGISGSDLTGCTRGADNGTARSHGDQSVVETMPTVGMWNNLATIVATAVDSNGYLRAIASPVSLANIRSTDLVSVSTASISGLFVKSRVDISAASVTGIGLYPVWRSSSAHSGPTTNIGGLLKVPKVATWSWISVETSRVASGASVVFDVMNNGTSIFAGVTKPTIVGGGTYVSTASINNKVLSPGQDLRTDIATLGTPGVITDVTVQGGTV
jgi:hypothetical protein